MRGIPANNILQQTIIGRIKLTAKFVQYKFDITSIDLHST